MNKREKILQVKDLTLSFGTRKKKFTAVKNVSFDIYKGEIFGLVGESGSGKTTIGRGIIRINPVESGEIVFEDKVISGKIDKATDRYVIDNIQMVFQDPMSSLNERSKVDYIVSEGLYARDDFDAKNDALREKTVSEALEKVGLRPEFSSRFPHEFSGGQRQRIGIARTLVMQPKLIIADEPISALDVSIRAQVLNLFKKLQREAGLTYLFVAHDLSVVKFFCDRIAVLYKGQIMELAESEKLFANPLHPYTRALLSAVPQPDPIKEKDKQVLVYDPECHDYSEDKPSFVEIEEGHFVLANKAELAKYQEMLETL